MASSQYKYVKFKRKRWVAQCRAHGLYEYYDSEMDAATAVKKVLGSKSLVFRCGSATGCRARASSADCPGDFKHLSWHPTRNRWLAHVRGKLFQYHVDKGSALKEIRRATGASISQLRFQTACGEIGNHAPHVAETCWPPFTIAKNLRPCLQLTRPCCF